MNKDTIVSILVLAIGALGGYFLIRGYEANMLNNDGPKIEESFDQAQSNQAFERVEQFIWDLDGVHPDKINLVSAEYVEWPNSCLGLPMFDELCAEAVVPGYRMTLNADGKIMIFRTNTVGSSIRRDLAAEKEGKFNPNN